MKKLKAVVMCCLVASGALGSITSVDALSTSKTNQVKVNKLEKKSNKTIKYDMIVDSKFSGENGTEVDGVKTFKTIQSCIDAVPKKSPNKVTIFIKNGTYKEKLKIDKQNISLIGEDRDKTILTYDVANASINPETGKTYGTGGSASVTITYNATNFSAENITMANEFVEGTFNGSGEQAVAVSNQADKSVFVNCKLIGNQDTLLTEAPGVTIDENNPLPPVSQLKKTRQYYYKCEIQGDVDFIFGRAQAVFDDCDIVSLNRGSKSNNGYITAASTWENFKYGYLIINSRLLGEEGIAPNSVSLGRPWHPNNYKEANARVAYINCYMGEHISTKGWDDMSGFKAEDADFFEYGSYGPGAKVSDTRIVLTDEQAREYTIANVFSYGYDSEWIPEIVAPVLTLKSEIPNKVTNENLEFIATVDKEAQVSIDLNNKNVLSKSYKANEEIKTDLTFIEGENTITVNIKDKLGRTVSKTFNVYYDKQWSDDLFTVSVVKVIDTKTNKKIRKISSGTTIQVDVQVKNNSLLNQEGTLVIGLFDENDNMTSYTIVKDSYDGEETINAQAIFNIPKDSKYSVKAYIKK